MSAAFTAVPGGGQTSGPRAHGGLWAPWERLPLETVGVPHARTPAGSPLPGVLGPAAATHSTKVEGYGLDKRRCG